MITSLSTTRFECLCTNLKPVSKQSSLLHRILFVSRRNPDLFSFPINLFPIISMVVLHIVTCVDHNMTVILLSLYVIILKLYPFKFPRNKERIGTITVFYSNDKLLDHFLFIIPMRLCHKTNYIMLLPRKMFLKGFINKKK